MQRVRVDMWDPVVDEIERMAEQSGVSPHRIITDALTMFVGLDLGDVPEPSIAHAAPFRLDAALAGDRAHPPSAPGLSEATKAGSSVLGSTVAPPTGLTA